MTAAEAAPLAVWGADEPPGESWGRWHSWPRWQEAEKWAADRGLCGSGRATYRIELYLVDAPFARVFQFACDDAGCVLHDFATGTTALADPVTVLLDDLPPAELLESPYTEELR